MGDEDELKRWKLAFGRFEKRDRTTPLPDGYWVEYLVYSLCRGKAYKREEVMERFTLSEAMKWNWLGAYDNVVQEELHQIAMEDARKKGKR